MDTFIAPIFKRYYVDKPLVLVDIGARGGIIDNWKTVDYLTVIGFEPDPAEFKNLKLTKLGKNWRYFDIGLYKRKSVLNLYITNRHGCSSIFLPNKELLQEFPDSERFDVIKKIKIKVDTLDNCLTEHKITDVDFIKIDTQGSELSILQGAGKTLTNSVFGLQVEVEFASLYKGQPLFASVDNFIRKLGFYLFDIKPIYWKRKDAIKLGKPKGQIIFADALYLKEPKRFRRAVDHLPKTELKKSKVLRALSICILYGYLDYALRIFQVMENLFTDKEKAVILSKIKKQINFLNTISDFPGRTKLANCIYSLYNVVKPPDRAGRHSDKLLGNSMT